MVKSCPPAPRNRNSQISRVNGLFLRCRRKLNFNHRTPALRKRVRYISRTSHLRKKPGCARVLTFNSLTRNPQTPVTRKRKREVPNAPRKSTPQTPATRKRKREVPNAPRKSTPQTPLVKLSKRKCPTAPFKK